MNARFYMALGRLIEVVEATADWLEEDAEAFYYTDKLRSAVCGVWQCVDEGEVSSDG